MSELSSVQEDSYSSPEESFKKPAGRQAAYVKDVLKIDTPESRHYAENNYATVKNAVPQFVLKLIKSYIAKRGNRGIFKRDALFTKVVDNKAQYNLTRQIFNCSLDWVMYFLIAVPVTLSLVKHGFLHVCGSDMMRSAMVVSYILSIKSSGDVKKRLQAFNEDFASFLSEFYGMEFGISVLVGCDEGSKVHLIPKSYGGDEAIMNRKIVNGEFTTVVLEEGEALVMGPGLMKRGCGYTKPNARLFLAFVAGRSKWSNFERVFNVFNIDTKGGVTNKKRTRD